MKLTTSDEDSRNLINNRQNGRRRGRGSGAPRPNGSGNGSDRGNRLDNRARGNASQLHEKYKAMARDAQMQGDRVMTEYYLQFADHYFRILSESRARFDEQRRPQGQEDYDNGEGEAGQGASSEDHDDSDGFDQQPRYEQPRRDHRAEQQQQRDPQQQRFQSPRHEARPETRDTRPEFRDPRPEPRGDGRDAREPREFGERVQPREDASPREDAPQAERKPRGRPRRDAAGNGGVANEVREAEPEPRIEMDRLPPALSVGTAAPDAASVEDQPRVRRRGRPRRADADEGTIQPDVA